MEYIYTRLCTLFTTPMSPCVHAHAHAPHVYVHASNVHVLYLARGHRLTRPPPPQAVAACGATPPGTARAAPRPHAVPRRRRPRPPCWRSPGAPGCCCCCSCCADRPSTLHRQGQAAPGLALRYVRASGGERPSSDSSEDSERVFGSRTAALAPRGLARPGAARGEPSGRAAPAPQPSAGAPPAGEVQERLRDAGRGREGERGGGRDGDGGQGQGQSQGKGWR